MRLSDVELDAIRRTIANLDPEARVYLFGSRTDDTRRGGDIDLLIMSNNLKHDDRGRICWNLWEQIGEQKIDIIIARDDADPFVKIALQNGVPLL
jgi:hypothetical protein